MSSIITTNFSTLLAQQFLNLLDITANDYLPIVRKSYLFVVLGKQTPWNVGIENPETPGQSTRDLIGYFDRGIVAKRITLENASFVIDRHNWTAGVVYRPYGCQICPIGTPFYVLNSKDQVFKCLSNNNGVQSTDEPQLFLAATSLEEPYFETSDGYKWKYMYTLSSAQKQNFLTSEWMPVTYNRFVRGAAINRSIDIVKIVNSGNNYVDGSTQDIITLEGDGIGAVLKANVVNGQVSEIVIQDRGRDYTRANLTFADVQGGVGSSASAEVVLSPQNGHGYDPVEELYASTIMFNVDFVGNESQIFPADNEFREVNIVMNPFEKSTSSLATSAFYTLYSQIQVSPGIGDFNNDEVVYQGDTFDTAKWTAEVISYDEEKNIIYVNNLNGVYEQNQPIKGLNSGAIRILLAKIEPTLQLYSGKVLFVSNKLPVIRDPDQTDRVRFILGFA